MKMPWYMLILSKTQQKFGTWWYSVRAQIKERLVLLLVSIQMAATTVWSSWTSTEVCERYVLFQGHGQPNDLGNKTPMMFFSFPEKGPSHSVTFL
mmetsp:Transcript_55673/g.161606  ORF Transcript_55673/g.161606 Transcript_55673/m.161606 type:complete len:95 (+) Transcript_55673:538-822(+)